MRAMPTTQKVALVDTTGLTRFVQGDTERNDSLPALLAKGWRKRTLGLEAGRLFRRFQRQAPTV